MKQGTSEKGFLMFMICKHLEDQGVMPTELELKSWSDAYKDRFIERNKRQGWTFYVMAFLRFVFAGFVAAIPGMLFVFAVFTYLEYRPAVTIFFMSAILQVAYISSVSDLISKFIVRGNLKGES